MKLETPRLILRELSLADAPALNLFESDPQVTRLMSCDVQSMQDSEAYVAKSVASQSEVPRNVYELAVIEKATGDLVARVGFRLQPHDARDACLWYVLRRESWGKGIAVEACRALVDFGFRELGLHRMWADVDPENGASRRVAEKLGMRFEAHFLENVFIKGEWRGTVILAVLDREWRGSP